MGVNFAMQWPSTMYLGALLGLQHQVRMNAVLMIVAAARAIGAAVALVFISATLEAFFGWQILVSALQTFTLAWLLRHSMPAAKEKGVFNWRAVASVGRFTTGVIGITLLSLALQQSDKLILSRLLTLSAFGYYTVAAAVAVTLARLVAPIHSTFFPRFAQLAGQGDEAGLSRIYHRACQLVAVVVLPAGVMLALFAPQIILLWTRDPDLTGNTHALVSVLVVGNALHALVYLPYALQLAYGWTRLAFATNLAAVLVLLPAIVFATGRWGAIGAACVWVALTAGYVFVQVPIMHRRLLRGELARWYFEDVAKPLLALLPVAAAGWLLVRSIDGTLTLVVCLAATALAMVAAAGLSVSWMRAVAVSVARRLTGHVFSLDPTSTGR
jgi:O-antigen/teichoic acid export membrane protein